jgi:hypothetical protein
VAERYRWVSFCNNVQTNADICFLFARQLATQQHSKRRSVQWRRKGLLVEDHHCGPRIHLTAIHTSPFSE